MPIERVRPLLDNIPDADLVRVLVRDPALYHPELNDRLLRTCRTQNFQETLVADLLTQVPEFRARYLKTFLTVPYVRGNFETVFNHYVGGSEGTLASVLTSAEREEVIRWGLGLQKPPFQWLHKLAKGFPAGEEKERCEKALREKIEELLSEAKNEDPIDLYLDGKISWQQLEYAKADPEGYQRWAAKGRLMPAMSRFTAPFMICPYCHDSV